MYSERCPVCGRYKTCWVGDDGVVDCRTREERQKRQREAPMREMLDKRAAARQEKEDNRG